MTLGLAIIVVLIVGALLSRLYAMGRRRAQRMQAVIATVEQRFGFRNNSPGGIVPNLHAEIGGLKTAVDVTYQSYVRGGSAPNGRRPYTRVRVQLETPPAFSVRIRESRYESPAEWPERPTGDAAFDARYVALAANEADLLALGPVVRAAFVDAELPVSLIGKIVVWAERNHTLEADRLVAAVQSCISVAAAVKRQAESPSGAQ